MPHASPIAVVLSGAFTGIIAIAVFSIFSQYRGISTTSRSPSGHGSTGSATGQPSDAGQPGRLRRSRHVRRRRNRSHSRRRSDEVGSNGESHLQDGQTDSDEDGDIHSLPIVKDWSDNDNKNLLSIIHAISESQSRKEGYIHRGITCNKCSTSPIRGIRYKCANCVDFDLCEMCESSNHHLATHVFLKIRIPIPPLANPRSALLPAFYPGNNNIRYPLVADKIRELQRKSHFDQVELEALFEQFKTLLTVDKSETEQGIDKDTFEQCLGPLGLKKNLITERIFAFFDQDNDGLINFTEFVNGLSVMCKGNLDEKIQYAFRGYDLDGDGYISREELYRMFKSYFYLSMELVRDVVSAMEDEMMDNFEFSASQPVSAAFNVALPASSRADSSESEESDDEAVTDKDYLQSTGAEAGPSSIPLQRTTSSQKSRKKKYPQKQDYFERQYALSGRSTDSDDQSSPDATLNDIHPGLSTDISAEGKRQRNARHYLKNVEKSIAQDSISPPKTWEEKFPIMETMSQDAINEMVDKTFKNIDTKRKGYISFEEFKQCVQTDSSIVSWFEALGTVF